MSFIVGVFVVEVGFIAWEMEGNGLRARDEGNGWLILGVARWAGGNWAGGKFVDDGSARGDDTKGRETVMFAGKRSGSQRAMKERELTHCVVYRGGRASLK